MENVKNFIARWWFLASSIALAFLYYLNSRQRQELGELHEQAKLALMSKKVMKIEEQSRKSDEDYEKAKTNYATLRARHGDLVKRLGIDS